MPELTEREEEALRNFVMSGLDGWVRPLDLGGRDGSNLSYLLGRLVKKGFVEKKKRGSSGSRGSNLYQLNDLGREKVHTLDGEGEG